MLNKESRSYFQKAFIVDGSVWNSIQDSNTQKFQVKSFAEKVGANVQNDLDLIKFLQTISLKDIRNQSHEFVWGPVVEGEMNKNLKMINEKK